MKRALVWFVAGAILAHLALANATVICTPLGSLTTNLSLCKPAAGETNWTNAMNNNFDVLDAIFSGLTGTMPNGAVPIGNGTGFTVATITGTTNRVTVANGAGSITLNTPQDTHTGATPQFSALGLGVTAGSAGTLKTNQEATISGNIGVGTTATPATNISGVVGFRPITFAALSTTLSVNGMMVYCSDCTIASPCAGGGTGAIAKRLNNINVCN